MRQGHGIVNLASTTGIACKLSSPLDRQPIMLWIVMLSFFLVNPNLQIMFRSDFKLHGRCDNALLSRIFNMQQYTGIMTVPEANPTVLFSPSNWTCGGRWSLRTQPLWTQQQSTTCGWGSLSVLLSPWNDRLTSQLSAWMCRQLWLCARQGLHQPEVSGPLSRAVWY
jgi:hypothetical protein